MKGFTFYYKDNKTKSLLRNQNSQLMTPLPLPADFPLSLIYLTEKDRYLKTDRKTSQFIIQIVILKMNISTTFSKMVNFQNSFSQESNSINSSWKNPNHFCNQNTKNKGKVPWFPNMPLFQSQSNVAGIKNQQVTYLYFLLIFPFFIHQRERAVYPS